MQYTVYMIENKVNRKRYIGYTSKSVEVRFQWHCERKNCRKLRYAIDKYGSGNFTITELYKSHDMQDALKAEAHLIEKYNTIETGYNLTKGGIAPTLSEESKRKMSEKRKGISRGPMSIEQRMKLSKIRLERGLKPTREAILKGLETKKRNAKPLPPDFGQKISLRQMGKNNPAAKSVVCVQTGKVFDTVKDAAVAYGLNKNCVSHNLNKRNKTVGKQKLTFKYLGQ
jgi:group I intron endonuclease